MLREEFIKSFTPADDRPAQRDRVRFARERPGARFAGFLVPHSAMPVRIVFPILEQRSISFESLPTRLTRRRARTFHWARSDHRS